MTLQTKGEKMNEIYNFNKTIKKCDSDGIKVICNLDFTDWTLIYLAKRNPTDNDQTSVISLTPTIIIEDGLKKILIEFFPGSTANVPVDNYFHALKVISPNAQSALTLFQGKLTIEQNYINAPEGE